MEYNTWFTGEFSFQVEWFPYSEEPSATLPPQEEESQKAVKHEESGEQPQTEKLQEEREGL